MPEAATAGVEQSEASAGPSVGNAGLGPLDARALRGMAWGIAGTVVLLFVFVALGGFPGRTGYLIGQWAFTAVCALTALATGQAWYRTWSTERRFWGFVTLAGALIFASQAYYTVYTQFVDPAGPRPISVSNYLDLASAVIFLALIATLTRFRHSSRISRVRYVIDLVAVGSAAALALYALVLEPYFAAIPAVIGPGVRVLASVYPVLGTLILASTVRNLVGLHAQRWESWERLVAAAFAALSAGIALWPLWYTSNFFGVPWPWAAALVEALWLAGVLLMMVGAVYRHTAFEIAWRLRPLPVAGPTGVFFSGFVMPALQIVAVPVFGVATWVYRADPSRQDIYVHGALTVMALLVTRTVLTAVDTGHLFSRSAVDPLTGLFNHRHFREKLASEIMLAEHYGEQLCVAFIDLDDFSRANASGGPAAGDRVLCEVADLLRAAVRDGDTVCRLGGDAFGVIVVNAAPAAASVICQRLVDVLRGGPVVDGRPVTASIGVSCYPAHSTDPSALLRLAEGAGYWAKHTGKDRVLVYDPAIVVSLGAEDRVRSLQAQVQMSGVRALAAAAEARDPGTEHHGRNVAALSVMLANEIGLDADTVHLIEIAGLLHDVGRIGVSDATLRKRGPLDDAEWAQMREHPSLGEHMLAATRLTEILPWVRHHHERWDGMGYPDGLAGEAIPMEARILAVCDAYDAMTHERSYRPAMSRAAAIQEIDLGMGTQFDPAAAEAFIRMSGRRPSS